MTEVEVSHLFSELAKSTEVLHKKSNSVNEIIERFQEKLDELKPGVEVWLPDNPLASRKQLVENGDEDHRVIEIAQELGYSRVDRTWTLAVREAQYNYDDTGDPDLVSAGEPEPLLKKSRRIRIEALGLFPTLLRNIKAAVEEAIESIDRAEKFVK